MGIQGQYVKTFSEANLACCDDFNLNSDYPHPFFSVIKVADGAVELESHRDGTIFYRKIKKASWTEYCEIVQESPMGKVMGFRPKKFKVLPFNGERF